MHFVGKLNREIFRCILEDIRTDEVIITENQVNHIKERHPLVYENFNSYFEEMITFPDYIIEASKPNTALILKQITLEG